MAEATAASSVVFLFLAGLCKVICFCFLDVRGIHHTGGGAEKRCKGLAIVSKPEVAAASCRGETSFLRVRCSCRGKGEVCRGECLLPKIFPHLPVRGLVMNHSRINLEGVLCGPGVRSVGQREEAQVLVHVASGCLCSLTFSFPFSFGAVQVFIKIGEEVIAELLG